MTAMLDAATIVRVWGLEGRLPRSPASVGFCSWPLEPCGVIARSCPLNGWGAGRTTGLFGSHDYLREWFCWRILRSTRILSRNSCQDVSPCYTLSEHAMGSVSGSSEDRELPRNPKLYEGVR